MNYRMLLWDFDGTLADTWSCGQEIYTAVAARHGFAPLTDPEAARRMSTLEFLRRHRIPLLKVPLVMREWHAALRDRMAGVALFPGVAEALTELHRRGCALGVLSSNHRDNILLCLRARGVEHLFALVVSYPRLFGKATGIRRVLREHGLGPRQLLYVGDEVRDLEAARKAGVDSAAVAWGLQPLDLLRRHGPAHAVDHPGQLLDLVGPSRRRDG